MEKKRTAEEQAVKDARKLERKTLKRKAEETVEIDPKAAKKTKPEKTKVTV